MLIIDLLFLLSGLFLLIFLGITLYNYFTAPGIVNISERLTNTPQISVLIYANNAEKFVDGCVRSVLAQSYNNFEIIVFDDNSNDRTGEIIKPFVERNSRLTLIQSAQHARGWKDKNWANSQMAAQASGELLLFLDAKIVLKENALNSVVEKMQQNNCEVISVFASQKLNSPDEFIMAPLFSWLLLSIVPVRYYNKSVNTKVTFASEHFLLFNKELYNSIGGFDVVKNKSAGHIELVRLVKQKGLKVYAAFGNKTISIGFNSGFESTFNLLVETLMPVFSHRIGTFLIYMVIIQTAFSLPVIFSFFDYSFIWLVFGIIINRFIVSFKSRQSPHIGILHPLQMIILFIISFSSLMDSNSSE